MHTTSSVPVAQWLRRVTTNHEIEGSSPSGDVFAQCHVDSRNGTRVNDHVSVFTSPHVTINAVSEWGTLPAGLHSLRWHTV